MKVNSPVTILYSSIFVAIHCVFIKFHLLISITNLPISNPKNSKKIYDLHIKVIIKRR